jgi:hypothetical protein
MRAQTARLVLCALAAAALAAPAAAPATTTSSNIRTVAPLVTRIRAINQDGKGVIITNAPYGYYRGRVLSPDAVTKLAVTRAEDNTYDRISQVRGAQRFVQCGWIESDTLRTPGRAAGAAACPQSMRAAFDRNSFGKDYNCAVSACLGGTKGTPLSSTCDNRAYYNRAPDSAAGGRESFFDYAGPMRHGELVHYRYTTIDGAAAVVLTQRYGWVYLARSCIAGHPRGGPAVLTRKLVTAEAGSCAGARAAVRRRTGDIEIACTQTGPTTYHCVWSLPGQPYAWEVSVTYRHQHFYVGIVNNVEIQLDSGFGARVRAYLAQLLGGFGRFRWTG